MGDLMMSTDERKYSLETKSFRINESEKKVKGSQNISYPIVSQRGKKQPAFSRAVVLRLIAWLEQL
jgi:hypothetical protein